MVARIESITDVFGLRKISSLKTISFLTFCEGGSKSAAFAEL